MVCPAGDFFASLCVRVLRILDTLLLARRVWGLLMAMTTTMMMTSLIYLTPVYGMHSPLYLPSPKAAASSNSQSTPYSPSTPPSTIHRLNNKVANRIYSEILKAYTQLNVFD